MASKRRVKRRNCERKQPFSTKEKASSAARALKHSRNNLGLREEFTVYKCKLGDHWHFAHVRRNAL